MKNATVGSLFEPFGSKSRPSINIHKIKVLQLVEVFIKRRNIHKNWEYSLIFF